MRKNNKKAISTLVATVLLILITVAGVAIIWGAVMPMITRITQSGQACVNARYNLDTSSGFTCKYTNGNVSVAISRGAEQFEAVGVQVIFTTDTGNTNVSKVTTNLPGVNEMRTYQFTTSGIGTVVEVSVAPIVKVGNTQTICDISSKVTLASCA